MLFRQFFDRETCTYSYLLADPKTGEGIFIDPVVEMLDRDLQFINELGVKLRYIFETHIHADHVTSSWILSQRTGALIAVGKETGIGINCLLLDDGDELFFGDEKVRVISTPGHTNGCISYLVGNQVFTGDALFIRGCGRTDFQQGDPQVLFSSIRQKIFTLPDETLIYPGHDYSGRTVSTVGEEKKFNPRLKLENSKEDFWNIMNNLNLDYPKKMALAVPRNLQAGQDA